MDLAAVHGDGAAFRARHGVPAGRARGGAGELDDPGEGNHRPDRGGAHRAASEFPQAHFLLAGEGKHRAEYMAMARDLGMETHFTWTGLVHNPVAEGLYTAADVVCQVSRWEEAFGWVIAEAMAAGRPLVATRVGGIPELVADGVSGFLVPTRAPAEIAQRVIQLLEDPALRARMGAAGRQAAEQKFDLERNLDALMLAYGFE